MKTVNLTDPTFAELCVFFNPPPVVALSAVAMTECQGVFQRVVAPPPPTGDWKAAARDAARAAGFSGAILYAWDWSGPNPTLDTINMGGIGVNGVLVVRFVTGVADNVQAQFSATGYPAPSMENGLRLTVSTVPCLVEADPTMTKYSPSPTLPYCVGTPPLRFGKPVCAGLAQNTVYYVCVAGRDAANQPTAVPGQMNYPHCDVRLSLNRPRGQ